MSDVFRRVYRQLTLDQKARLDALKVTAEGLYSELEAIPVRDGADGRCIALAKTKLEESVMWATKAIT